MTGFALFLAAFADASTPAATFRIDVTGQRSTRGSIHACLTRNPAHFPDCRSDPAAIVQTVPASAHAIIFRGVPPGHYALALFHDANANRKLDTVLGVPREGFGFSRNPKIGFGPPRFEKVSIELTPGFARASVRLQYVL